MVVYALEHPEARKWAYSLLAWAAQRLWGFSELPEIVRGEYGKPAFSQFPQFQFNISHSGDLAVCALGETPVGVDIQIVSPRRGALLDRVCSPAEREWLKVREDSPRAFAMLWSMKESCCKHSGRGLQNPISSIAVPLPESGEKCLRLDGLNFYLESGSDWQFCLCSREAWDGTINWISDINDIKGEKRHDSTGM